MKPNPTAMMSVDGEFRAHYYVSSEDRRADVLFKVKVWYRARLEIPTVDLIVFRRRFFDQWLTDLSGNGLESNFGPGPTLYEIGWTILEKQMLERFEMLEISMPEERIGLVIRR